MKYFSWILVAVFILGVRLAAAQDTAGDGVQVETGLHIVMLAKFDTPDDAEGQPLPEIDILISFRWPAELGGVENCEAFISGATFWRPANAGEMHGVMNCVDIAGDG